MKSTIKARPVIVGFIILAAVALAFLSAVIVLPAGNPVGMSLAKIEPSGMVDENGKEPLLVTLTVSNLDSVAVMFEQGTNFQARVAGRWVEVSQDFGFQVVPSRRKHNHMFLMPAGAEACRFRLNYQTEMWKSRVMAVLGPKGRAAVAKVPWLYKRICPNQYATMRVPPSYREIELEVSLPGGDSASGTNSNTAAPPRD
jgi:hypothetical protein